MIGAHMIYAFEGIAPTLADAAFIAPDATVIGDVQIGKDSTVWYGTVIRGDVHFIRIGSQTNIQDRCVLHVTTGKFETRLGNRVTVGHGAILHGCRIADRVLVGMGAVVLDDVDVASDCIVGAGALLSPGKKYPAGSLIVGSPAKVVRPLRDDERDWIEKSADAYVQLGYKHRLLIAQ